MGKVSRADWAASVPWGGVIDKPATFGVTDIGGLTGTGYSAGQYPAYNKTTKRFQPASIIAPPAPIPPEPYVFNQLAFNWDGETLHSFQISQQDFDFVGAMPSQVVAVGASFALDYLTLSAYVPSMNVVRITVMNTQITDVTVGSGTVRIILFPQ